MKYWPAIVVVLILLPIGIASATRPRFGESHTAKEEQRRLDSVPLAFGDWNGTITEVPAKQLKVAEAQAHLSRTYLHKDSKSGFNVLILFGTPGALGAHTPEVCFEGAGHKLLGPAKKKDLPKASAELWSSQFEAFGSTAILDVLWGIGDNNVWTAPENARISHSDRQLVHKIYISRIVPPHALSQQEGGPLEEFASAFLIRLKESRVDTK